MRMLRQPIVAVMGHVDHGKTTLLDRIRGTAVAEKEAGYITQHSGASEIPIEAIRKTCGGLITKMKLDVKIPGLLFLDTPGHEAFTSIRRRGSSIADIAVLVIDLLEGIKPQTDESIQLLKQFKTPFIIAATKVDKLSGWISSKDANFSETLARQPERVREEVDAAVYKLVGQLSERGFDSERYDRVNDFRKQVAIVPCSGITGEGVPDLLMMLTGLAQNFLKDKIGITSDVGRGSILEIKEVRGLGLTADMILYDGEIRKGDTIVIGGADPIVTKIKALLKPKPLRDIRVEKEFEQVERVGAAAGVKISAPGLEAAIAGSPIIALRGEEGVGEAKEELREELCGDFGVCGGEGVMLKADTLGSVEALIHMLKQRNMKINKAGVGPLTKKEVVEMETVADKYNRVIFVFNLPLAADVEQEAKSRGIKVFRSNIIYALFEEYDKWAEQQKEIEKREELARINMPAKIELLKGFVFRQNDPAIVGVEVLDGRLRPGAALRKKDGSKVGTVKAIQVENVGVEEAEKGQRVAVSIDGPTVGRQIKEGDILVTSVGREDLKVLDKYGMPEAKLARELLGK
ncbi:MAG: translation initiation factor IF-2 [Candidatus Aenigmatarchaeota archaeon]